jgi:hypothetical protein
VIQNKDQIKVEETRSRENENLPHMKAHGPANIYRINALRTCLFTNKVI